MNEVTAALINGRRLLVTNGWIREKYRSECGYCAVGAIRVAAPVTSDYMSVEDRAVALLADCLPEGTPLMAGPFSTVFNWNDKLARDVNDVLAVFDRAIAVSSD